MYRSCVLTCPLRPFCGVCCTAQVIALQENVAALAALNDVEWAHATWRGIAERREWLGRLLTEDLGLRVFPSQANFILVDFGALSATAAMAALKERRILVRQLTAEPRTANCLRITIGGKEEMDALVTVLRECVPRLPPARERSAAGSPAVK